VAVAETVAMYGLRPLTPGEFRKFQDLVGDASGIHLSPAKKALLVGRLSRRVHRLGLASFGEYYARVCRDSDELVWMLDAICTNETHFFREPKQFEFLESQVYPAWKAAAQAGRRARHIRAWSAACSSGEEPYSAAMSLREHFPLEEGWTIEITATDLSTKILARAESGVWPIAKADEIPERRLRRFMLRGVGTQEGRMKAGPELRSLVRFVRMNLNAEPYTVSGRFDLIFCRNVLIYFGTAAKTAVLRRLIDRLAPEGLLLLGHAETLSGFAEGMRSVGPTVYQRRGENT
jgi:chemotaxis protein methyltransferase CheR